MIGRIRVEQLFKFIGFMKHEQGEAKGMIKGSTKVGEVFICGQDSEGTLEVLPQYLGKAITGLGGGCDQMFVIEEDEGFLGVVSALQPRAQVDLQANGEKDPPFRNNTHDGNRPSGRKHQALAHQKFGMTPFDQQQQQQQNAQAQNNNPMALVDQKIEERESLRHSTHRSQRSERLSQQQQQQQVKNNNGNFHQTASDRFDNTEYNISDKDGGSGMAQQRAGANENGQFGMQFGKQDGYATSMTNQQQPQNSGEDEPEVNKQALGQNTTGQETSEEQQQTWQQQQAQRNTSTNLKRGLSNTQQADNMGRLQQISCGKEHTLNLTRDGDVFSHGLGQYCVAGHGGSREAEKPMILKPLRDKRVVQIACGEFHSLVLTDKGYLYSWGRGFEGQLGISPDIEIAAAPSFVKFFHKVAIQSVAAGSHHSLAITEDGDLYSWGEGKLGQLGLGKCREKRMPQRVAFDFDGQEEETGEKSQRVRACAAGFGHTAALTDGGSLYMWGFNVYGQVGVGDKKTRWHPEQICYSAAGEQLPQFSKVACSKYATYAIDSLGRPYSWGKGYTGHQGLTMFEAPNRIESNTENRIFTDVFANSDSALLYSPIRVFQIEPKCGPSRGGTIIKIVGTGFVDSNKLRVRFSYGALSREVNCSFDHETRALVCRTPVFQEFETEGVNWPMDCFLSVTMDGTNYSECEEPFVIYSNDIYLTSVNPKCGSISGGTQVTLELHIDDETAKTISTLKLGFQAKKQNTNKSIRGSTESQNSPGGDEFSQGDWIWTEGVYEDGKVRAIVPALDNFSADNMSYNVDVALNGQQFSRQPVSFRYYDIEIERVDPDFGPMVGGTNVVIVGRGLYDASIKRIQFETDGGEGMREVTAEWDRQDRAIRCIVPPLEWMFNSVPGTPLLEKEEVSQEEPEKLNSSGSGANKEADESKAEISELTPEQIRHNAIAEKPIKIRITFNNQEWIMAKTFKYHDAHINRLAYAHGYSLGLDQSMSMEERELAWMAEEPEEGVEENVESKQLTDEEKKKADLEKEKIALEREKQIQQETEEVSTMAKRRGYKIWIHGSMFMNSDQLLSVRFSYNGGEVEKSVVPVFKNHKLLGVSLPDMGELVPIGQHMLNVELTLNGQQYTDNGLQVLFNQVDPNLTEEDLKKMDEDEAKNQKKGAKKK